MRSHRDLDQVGKVQESGSRAASAPRFHLHTLGTLRLAGSNDDTVLGDHGHQRRRLALLAVLAAAGERGRSRDQLLGLFWPDVSQSRARHSLEQLLYAIRTSLDPAIFTGANPVQLNPDLIESDVGKFSDSLARGDLEEAVGLYGGPFLDGFYLTDSPDFEQWVDSERARLERSYIEALERLARAANAANDYSGSARRLQKLVETDPVSSKHALALIKALSNAGDHAAALRYAERYEAIVRQELGTGAGPAVASAVAEVREKAKSESVVIRGSPSRPRPAAPPAPTPAPAAKSSPDLPQSSEILSQDDAVPRAVDDVVEPDRPRRRAGIYFVAAVAVIAIVIGAMSYRSRPTAPLHPAAIPSIAVLPFANVSGDPRDVPVVDGLSEELMGVLSTIDGLRVVARTSAFAFKNTNLDARQIGDSLRVSYILEGGVQKIGQRIRVQLRLIDAGDASTRWSETYDRQIGDIFAVQSDIANAVARELDLRLARGAVANLGRRPTRNIAAYELYLRGSNSALLRSDSAARSGFEYFRQAIELDSTYAAAYAGLARMYFRLTGSDLSPARSPRESFELATRAAEKALALDPRLAEAHVSRALAWQFASDFAAAEAELKMASRLDPSDARVHEFLGVMYTWKLQPADALAEARLAVQLDPLSPTANAELARTLCANGQTAEGLEQLKRVASLRPPLGRATLYALLCHGLSGNWPMAVASRATTPGFAGPYGLALAKAGRRDEARTLLAQATKDWELTRLGASDIAMIHTGLGNRDEAFEWLNRAVGDFSLPQRGATLIPLIAELHADPRFRLFLARLKI